MPGAEEDLNTAMIVRVAVDREGEVFLAIPAGFAGIGRYEGNRLKYYSYDGQKGIITYYIAVDSQNAKWGASQDGLYKIVD